MTYTTLQYTCWIENLQTILPDVSSLAGNLHVSLLGNPPNLEPAQRHGELEKLTDNLVQNEVIRIRAFPKRCTNGEELSISEWKWNFGRNARKYNVVVIFPAEMGRLFV